MKKHKKKKKLIYLLPKIKRPKIREDCKNVPRPQVRYLRNYWKNRYFKDRYTKTAINRFLKFIEIDNNTECWLWMGGRKKHPNYGHFWFNRKTLRAHIFSYRIFVNKITEGLFVCHNCDNPPCVNPNHLWLGTCKDNLQDMKRKGRSAKGLKNGKYTKPESTARGENQGSSKLKNEDILFIRKHYKKHVYTAKMLSEKFKVSESLIRKILRKIIWRHLL